MLLDDVWPISEARTVPLCCNMAAMRARCDLFVFLTKYACEGGSRFFTSPVISGRALLIVYTVFVFSSTAYGETVFHPPARFIPKSARVLLNVLQSDIIFASATRRAVKKMRLEELSDVFSLIRMTSIDEERWRRTKR